MDCNVTAPSRRFLGHVDLYLSFSLSTVTTSSHGPRFSRHQRPRPEETIEKIWYLKSTGFRLAYFKLCYVDASMTMARNSPPKLDQTPLLSDRSRRPEDRGVWVYSYMTSTHASSISRSLPPFSSHHFRACHPPNLTSPWPICHRRHAFTDAVGYLLEEITTLPCVRPTAPFITEVMALTQTSARKGIRRY